MSQRHPAQNEAIMMVTTNTLNREPIFQNDPYALETIECLYRLQQLHAFFLYAFVVMPNHCHFLIRVPEPGKISNIISIYKSGLAHDIGIGPIWQRRFFNRIVDDPVGARYYIHMNPVRAGLCKKSEDYRWSSASGKWDVSEFEGW